MLYGTICAGLVAGLTLCATTPAMAQNPFERIFGDIAGQIQGKIEEEISGGLREGLDTLRVNILRNSAKNAKTSTRGYCQVWRSSELAVQKRCGVKRACGSEDLCVILYVWPNGRTTELLYVDGAGRKLNDFPTQVEYVGVDRCQSDGPNGDIFCYTAQKQAPDSMGLSVAKQNEEVAPTPALQSANADQLLNEYLAATESAGTEDSRLKRCQIGATLVADHSDTIDSELRSLILGQIETDQCLN